MKKLFFLFMAVGALTFASCSESKPSNNEAEEALAEADPQGELPDEASDLSGALDASLKTNNGTNFVGLLMNIPEKVAGLFKISPEKAIGYLQTAQNFISENKDAITGVISKITDSDLAKRATDMINTLSSKSPLDYFAGMGLEIPAELKDQAGQLLQILPEDVQNTVGGLLGQ